MPFDSLSANCQQHQRCISRRTASLCSSPSSVLQVVIAVDCTTKELSALNASRGEKRSQKPSLSQPENCPQWNNVSRLRAARFISAVLVCFNVITAGQIVRAIKGGQWTSTQVVTAFIKSAVRAQDETNCITEGEWPICLTPMLP